MTSAPPFAGAASVTSEYAVGGLPVERARLRRPSTAWNDDRGLIRECGLHFLAFHLAEHRLAFLGEDQGDRLAFFPDQNRVDVHESRMQSFGDNATDGCLPRARQSDEHEMLFHASLPGPLSTMR